MRAVAGVILLAVVVVGGLIVAAINAITEETWPEI